MRYFIITLFISLSVTANAQQAAVTDSLFMHNQNLQNFDALKWGLPHLLLSPITKASVLELGYHYEGGHYRTAQQAEKTSEAAFKTEGISTLNRFKLYGYFSFTKTWQDSLALSQKGIENEYQPYYHFSVKAGPFERQTYTGGGLISYELIKDKFFIGTGIDYLYNRSDRSIDPRSTVITYNLKFDPQITYKTKYGNFGLTFHVGYGDESVAIKYKNSRALGDRISYINYGFGYSEPSQNNFNRKLNNNGLALNYAGSFNHWTINTAVDYKVENEDNRYPKNNSASNLTFGIYQLETYSFKLLLNKKGTSYDHQFYVLAQQENGDDNLIEKQSRNYTYNSTAVNLLYSFLTHKNAQPSTLWFAKLNYKDVAVRDASVDNNLSYSYLNPYLGNTIFWKYNKSNIFTTEFAIGARLPLNSNVYVPDTQIKVFTQGVVFPNYMYYSSTAAEIQFKANYSTDKILKNFKTGFTLKSSYVQRIKSSTQKFNTAFTPDKNFLGLDLGLNLYF